MDQYIESCRIRSPLGQATSVPVVFHGVNNSEKILLGTSSWWPYFIG
jgi:hypothetical protein